MGDCKRGNDALSVFVFLQLEVLKTFQKLTHIILFSMHIRLLRHSRERNREHARKTRLRKKAHLESLKVKLSELQSEVS